MQTCESQLHATILRSDSLEASVASERGSDTCSTKTDINCDFAINFWSINFIDEIHG